MKTKFATSPLFAVAVGLALGAVPTAHATINLWTNSGTILTPPQIDATNVFNSGSLGTANSPLFTAAPFDTSNTQNVTNHGVMHGSVGFRFDTAPRNSSGNPIAPRKLARSFHNRGGSQVMAYDGPLLSGYTGSYIWVHATNVFSQGFLTAGVAGEIQVVGTNVNLSRGGVQITPILPQGTAHGVTNYLPDAAIYDIFWGQTNMQFDSSSIITGLDTNFLINSPVFPVQGGATAWQIGFLNPIMAGYSNLAGILALTITNSDGEAVITNVVTNFTHQAVFVEVSDRTNAGVNITFYPSSIPTNNFMIVGVQLGVSSTNLTTQLPELTTIFLADTLAADTDRGLLLNVISGGFSPANYWLARLPLFEGFGPNVKVTTNFLWDVNWGNPFVLGEYAGYCAFIDNVSSTPPPVPAGTVTNYPGRVKIVADNLDLTRTRVRAEGLITVETRNSVVSSNAILDSQHLSFNLTSTTGNLQVQNLMKQSVARTRGYTFAWSGLWNNTITQLIENYVVDTNGATLTPVTNIVTVGCHVLMLDAQFLLTQLPVTVYDLRASSTNISLNDTGSVSQSFRLSGESLTVNGGITLGGVLQEWVHTNTPGLRYFTNNGSISVPNEAHFGDDMPGGYLAFVNRGSITANSVNVLANTLICGGNLSAPASVILDASSARMENGQVNAGNDLTIKAGVLRLHQQILAAESGSLYLYVTNSLSDSGGSAGNVLEVHNGFHLPFKPAYGDLLGTEVQSTPLQFAESIHSWSGQDRGASPIGFKDNVAIGRLSLGAGLFSTLTFTGTTTTPGETNALYVDYLELDSSIAADLANTLNLAPNFIIYFADANVSVHSLDGQFGGRLRWVRNFAGPNSSVMAVVNGTLMPVNRALRQSTQMDSDADGLANGYDPSPFDPVSFTVTAVSNHAVLTWRGAVGTSYRVESATNLSSPTWEFLLSTNHPWSTNAQISVRDPQPMDLTPRVYRVSYAP